MIEHKSPISGISAFKEQYIATAGYDNKVILWDALSGDAIACGHHDHLANQCQFSPCGNYLLSASSDYTARIWQLPSMKLQCVLGDHEDDVEYATFHPSKNLVLTCSRDKKIRVFDFHGHLLHKLSGHEKDVISVTWMDHNEILSSSDDGTVRKWSLDSNSQIENIDLGGVETDTIVITSNGVIFAGNDDGNIIVIDGQEIKNISAHKAGVKRLCYSREKNMLVSLSYDRTMILWKVNESGNIDALTSSSFHNIVWARSCAFLGDDKLVFATFGTKYAIYNYKNDEWDITDVKSTFGINAVAHDKENIYTIGDAGELSINGIAHNKLPSLCNFLLKFGNAVISGGQSGEIYNTLTSRVIYQHTSPLNCAAKYYSNGKEYAIVGSYTGEGLVLGLDDNNEPEFVTSVKLHNNAIKGISTNNKYIFSVCADSAVAFHNASNLSLEKYVAKAHSKIANACARLNENEFLSVSRDLKMRIFNINGIVKEVSTQHKNSMKCAAVTNDGKYVATGDYAGNIYVYKNIDRPYLHIRPTCSGISSIIANQNQDGFIASSYDGNLYPINL